MDTQATPQPQAQTTPSTPHFAAYQVTVDLIESIEKSLRPTREEVAGMIQGLMISKTWSLGMLSSVLRINPMRMRNYKLMIEDAPGPELRLIWLFYTLDTAPELAMNLVHIASWGRVHKAIRKVTLLTPERRAGIINEIKEWDAKNGNKNRLTLTSGARIFNVNITTMRGLFKKAGYHPSNGTLKSYRKQRVISWLQPTSVWLHTDWRKKDKEIAERLGVGHLRVKSMRLKYKHISPRTLRSHIKACGINEEWYETIFKHSQYKQVKRYVKKEDRAPAQPVEDENIIFTLDPE